MWLPMKCSFPASGRDEHVRRCTPFSCIRARCFCVGHLRHVIEMAQNRSLLLFLSTNSSLNTLWTTIRKHSSAIVRETLDARYLVSPELMENYMHDGGLDCKDLVLRHGEHDEKSPASEPLNREKSDWESTTLEQGSERLPRHSGWRSSVCPWNSRPEGLYGWWTIEVLSYIGSIASLSATIVILKVYDGRTQPAWPHNLTLNSVLSWFTILFKATLLVPIAACLSQASWIYLRRSRGTLLDVVAFDSASRGVIGSLNLLQKFWTR